MSLEDWLNDKLIVKHRPPAGEVAELLHICDRDLEKAEITELGPDWRLSIAHNAAVQTAKAALAAVGYRARKEGQHYLVLQSLAFTVKTNPATIKQLDKFGEKRNISDYERAGLVTEQEAEEMMALAKQLRDDVSNGSVLIILVLPGRFRCRCMNSRDTVPIRPATISHYFPRTEVGIYNIE